MHARARQDGRRLRKLARVLLVIVAVVLLLAVAAILALDTAPGRSFACETIRDLANGSIRGTLRIGHCAELSASRLRIEHVALLDPSGRRVLTVRRITVEPDLPELLSGRIRARAIDVDDVVVSIASHGDQLDLAAAVEPREPSTDPGGEPPRFLVDRLRIRRARIRGLPNDLAVDRIGLEVGLGYDRHFSLGVGSLSADLLRRGARVAELRETRGSVQLQPGARSELAATLRSGTDYVVLRARTGWTETGPGPLEASATFAVTPALFERLGLESVARSLAAPVSGRIEARGRPADLAASAEVTTAGGSASLEGSWDEDRFRARARTRGIELARVLAEVEPHFVAGDVTAELGPEEERTGARALQVRVADGRLDELVLPAVAARGVLTPELLHVTGLDVPHLTQGGGRLDVDGRIRFAGGASLRLDAVIPQIAADANVRRLAPDARAGVEAHLVATISAEGRLDARGHVTLRDARTGGASAGRLDVQGFARGELPTPEASIVVTGGDILAGGQRITEVDLRLAGGPDRYRVAGALALAGGRAVRVDLGARADSRGVTIDGTVRGEGLWSSPLDVSLRRVRIDPTRSIAFGEVGVAGRGLRARGRGTIRFSGRAELYVTVAEVDLAQLDRVLALNRGLSGVATASARMRGSFSDPHVELTAAVEGGRLAAVPLQSVRVQTRLDAPGGALALATHIGLGNFGRADLRVEGSMPSSRRATLVDRLRDASWRVSFEGREISPRLICVLDPEAPVLDGKVEVRLTAEGTLASPSGDLTVTARAIEGRGFARMAFDLGAELRPDHLSASASASDALGKVAAVGVRTSMTLAELVLAPAPRELLAAPWQVNLDVPERRLDAMPPPLQIALPMRVRAGAVVRGGGEPLSANAHFALVTDANDIPGQPSCGREARPELRVDLALRDGETRVHLRGAALGRQVLEAFAEADTPIDEWIQGVEPAAIPPVRATLRARGVPLEAVPGVCTRASGSADVTLDATDLFTRDARLDLQACVQALRVGENAPPSDVGLRAALTNALATLHATVHTGGAPRLSLDARVPVRWGGGQAAPALADEPWTARLHARHAPIAPLVAAVPAIEQPRGRVDGTIEVRGTGPRWAAEGALTLERVSFIVSDPLLRVDDMRGRLRVSPEAILFEDLRMRDGDGRLSANGRLAFARGAPSHLEARLRTSDYPVRVDGVVYAIVDVDGTIEGNFGEAEGDRVRVNVRELAARLPEQSGRAVQQLDQHPDVVYVDPLGRAEARERRRENGEGGGAAPRTLTMKLVAERPFWVRRNDFSIQLTSSIELRREGQLVRIAGPIEVRRGYLQLLGKSFAFEPGEIRFDGGRDVNPLLRLRAVHRLASGDTVTVQIGGRLMRPDLAFSTTVADAVTEIEILELLVRGRGGPASQTARDQAVSAISGLTAGLISSITRRELGDFIPVLALEATGGGGARIHAGIEADRIIPRGLRSVVQGAYVEGIWGAAESTEGGNTGSRGGFLIELYLPKDLVTSGTYEEPDNWSIDLSWEP